MGLWLKQDGELVPVSGGSTGADGVDGKGWTGGTYDPATGTVTFTSDDGLEFTTGDLRGTDAIDGLDGNMWHVGSGDPASTLGDPGDYYLDGDAGWVWVKRTDTSWTNLYVNLTGPPGSVDNHDHDYLPLSGGTLTGSLNVQGGNAVLNLRNSTATSKPYMAFYYNGTRAGYVGYPSAASGGNTYLHADNNTLRLQGTKVQVATSLQVDGAATVGGNSDLKINVPADFWSRTSGTVFSSLGMLGGTQGSYATSMTSNGYRNTSGKWTSLALNGNAGAVQISLLPTGVYEVRTKGNHPTGSSSNPPLRLSIDDVKTKVFGDLQVDGNTYASGGAIAAPSYSFANNTASGLYSVPALGDNKNYAGLALVADGYMCMEVRRAKLTVGKPSKPAAFIPAAQQWTSGMPSNVYCGANGQLFQSTATRASMTEVEPVTRQAVANVLDLEPIWHRSTCDGDNPAHSRYGFAAEDVAEVDPRLATHTEDDDGNLVPDNVDYGAITALLVSVVKEQRGQIAELTARLDKMEGMMQEREDPVQNNE